MGVQAAWAILPVAFAGYLVGGVGHGVKNVLLRALIAVRVPEAVHGRAFAAYNAARSAAELGAVGAGGVLVSALGPRAALVLAGLGPILAAAAGLAALRLGGGASTSSTGVAESPENPMGAREREFFARNERIRRQKLREDARRPGGEVTIPIDIRERLGRRPGTALEFTVDGDAVRITKAADGQHVGELSRSSVS